MAAMSIYAISWVWKHSTARDGALLTLLALADYARDDDEYVAWPSQAALIQKTRLSERGVRDAIRRLVTLGELEVLEGDGKRRGRADHRCNRYRLVMKIPAESDQKYRQSVPKIPAESAPGTLIEPPGEPSPSPAGSGRSSSEDQDQDPVPGPGTAGGAPAVRTAAQPPGPGDHDRDHEGLTDPGTSVAGGPASAGDCATAARKILGPPPDTPNAANKRNDLAGDYAEPVPKLSPPLSSAEKTTLRLAMAEMRLPHVNDRFLEAASAMVLAEAERAGNRIETGKRVFYLRAVIWQSPERFARTPQPGGVWP